MAKQRRYRWQNEKRHARVTYGYQRPAPRHTRRDKAAMDSPRKATPAHVHPDSREWLTPEELRICIEACSKGRIYT